MIRLSSGSETRAKLLDKFNVKYIQSSVDFNEDSIQSKDAKSFVYSVALGKLESAINRYGIDMPILVADTVIATKNGEMLRKAKSRDDAKDILLKQSGSEISIISATILKSKNVEFIDISSTNYHFKEFEKNDLEEYLDSLKWQGKAGACMVEGFCKKYIKSVYGLESNAMGLPVEKLLPWIDFLGKYDG